MAEPSLLRIYMPPLLAKWEAIPDTDRELLPLLECLTSLAAALGTNPSPPTSF
jgi:transportin-1